ncbi:MAG TPA: hypothetical protein VFW06_09210 [Acidimicrobiia bacterium]|nr:hypothetical protein [Acidimicrobiia bacterium]
MSDDLEARVTDLERRMDFVTARIEHVERTGAQPETAKQAVERALGA